MNLAAWHPRWFMGTFGLLLAAVLLVLGISHLDPQLRLARQRIRRNTDWVPVVDRSLHGIEFVLVPVGCFGMGNATDGAIDDGGEQCFDEPFWLSRYEITNAQYDRCVTAGICEAPRCTDDPAFNGPDQPVVCVDWFQAQAFAHWINGSLPSEAQWEYVARGPDGLAYPWGSDVASCGLSNLAGCNGATLPVGSFSPAGDSWVGAGDMAGNVSEWTATAYDAYPYDATAGREATTATSASCVVRGGSWQFGFNARSTSRYGRNPSGSNRNLGFRLVITTMRFN